VLYLTLPAIINSVSLYANSLITAYPALVREVGTHLIAHSMNSYIRSGRNLRVSRRLRRRAMHQKRRWFVDNIIMHHKRLHDHNRELAIKEARKRGLKLNNKEKKDSLVKSVRKPEMNDRKDAWQQKILIKEYSKQIRGRIEARRVRARTRWLTVKDNK
jgi:hypothetical protein